jgi:hypothetical protein
VNVIIEVALAALAGYIWGTIGTAQPVWAKALLEKIPDKAIVGITVGLLVIAALWAWVSGAAPVEVVTP